MRENRPQKCYACDVAKVSCYVGLIPPQKKKEEKKKKKKKKNVRGY